MTIMADKTIRQTIEIEAPAQAVFDALTQPDQLVSWWNDERGHAIDAMESDLRVGGAWRIDGHKSDGSKLWMRGEYTRIEPPALVEFTWNYHWAPEGAPPTLVRFDLVERDGKTTLTLTHGGFVDDEGYEDHNEGWSEIVLPLLQAWFAKRQA